MEDGCTVVTLADICMDISYGFTASATTDPVGPKFLRITDIQGGVVNWKDVPFCEANDSAKKKNKLKNGDIVIARTGNSTGENYYFDAEEDALFASYLIRFRIDPVLANPYFVWLQLRTMNWWNFVAGSRSGSAQAGANAKVLGRFEINLPHRSIQDKVEKVARSINDKLRVNLAINQTLEQMAQAIFKSWFVDFEPVKAKMAAKESWLALQPAAESASPVCYAEDTVQLPDLETWMNLAAMQVISGQTEAALNQMADQQPEQFSELFKTAALFPAAMQDSELGEIPEGWEVLSLGQMINLIGGGTPKKSEPSYWNGEIRWFSIKDVPSEGNVFVVETEDKITEEGLRRSSTKLLPIGTTIITARGTVGKLALTGISTAMNQSCYGVTANDETGPYLNYLRLSEAITTLKRNTHGAVFDTITRVTFDTVLQPRSCLALRQRFEQVVTPMFETIRNNLLQSNTLSETRDSLLPKLLSGELSVADLELEETADV